MAIILPAKRKFLAPPLVRTIDDRRDPLNLGLAGHWSMDAETINSTRVLDLSGRDSHGTLIGGSNIMPGRVGQALSFNGSTQYVNAGSGLDLATFTICAWVFPTAFTNYGFIMNRGDSGNRNYQLYVNQTTGTINVGFTNGFVSYRNLDSVTALALNKWSFACGSFDGALLKTYINGVFDSTNGQAFVPQTGVPGALTIGCELSNPALTPADFFTGSLDDVRLYNRALTPAEIWRLYNNPTRDRAPYQTRGRTKSAGGLSTITGTLAVTEANDTIAAVGRVAVGGTLAVTEQADTIAAAGAVRVAGTLASTEQPDTLAATGTVTSPGAITGTLSAFQAVQTLIATGQIRVNGGLNVSQAAQTLAATGIVGIVVPPPSGQGVQVIVIS
jgi:hypothetical protein